MIYPIFQQGNDLPPTLYSIMESIVNFNNGDKSKITNLWQKARVGIFDFNYPLTENVSHETFEHNILNHYLMRRINFETVTLFKIMLENKLNEIMPKYNLMWDSLDGWEVFKAGSITRTYTDVMTGNNINKTNTSNINTTSNTINNTSSDTAENSDTTTSTNTTKGESTLINTTSDNSTASKSHSDAPQNNIEDVKNGEYVSQFDYDVVSSTSSLNSNNKTNDETATSTNTTSTTKNNGTSTQSNNGNSKTSNVTNSSDDKTENRVVNETITRTVENELDVLIKFQREYNSIWTMIYKDLDILFYGLV